MKKKILYVDDEPLNLELFTLNFSKSYEVLTAESGEKGLKVLHDSECVSAVISDMKMPGMNGLEFIRKAKKNFPCIGYYILTGFSITDEIQDALKSQLILEYFAKPFNYAEISVVLDNQVL